MKNRYNFDNRKYVFCGIVSTVFFIYLIRLFLLQVLSDDYKTSADSNAFYNRTIYPSRGLIYDRNGSLLVYNRPTYDIMVTMRDIKDLDTTDFCNTMGFDKEWFVKRMAEIKDKRKNIGYSGYTPQLFYPQLTPEKYGKLQEKLYRYSGFSIRNRSLRDYATTSAGLMLGYIGEISTEGLKKDDYYVLGDYAGASGIESSYETHLRGEKGYNVLLRDAHGRLTADYEGGSHDVEPVPGRNLELSIDIDLQAFGERLMSNKVGSIVAIEPSSGEILALVSSPTYDPNLFAGKDRGSNLKMLEANPHKPLFNRALMAMYPPGSTFKTAQALACLQEGALTPASSFSCYRGYPPLGGKPACHPHGSPLPLVPAIATSCNAYFCFGLRNLLDNRKFYPSIHEAMNKWRDHMVDMGFGYPLGVDLPNEKRGLIPNSEFYSKRYGENGWRAHSIISIAIGQGEILLTPLQIANLSATIANRGYYYVPHVVHKIQGAELDSIYTHPHYTGIDKTHYLSIVEGMEKAVTGGTARGAQLNGIVVCGKTGTAENPHGKDHSLFMAFAPKDDPKIAIAVVVENAGFGATFAVPIASLMMERYLKGSVSDSRKHIENHIANTKIMPVNVKK